TTPLAGRLIFVYAGNMGIAQNVDIFLGLAECLKQRNDIGFLFVGRGSHYQFLLDKANKLKLNNTLFFDEIEPEEIASLYSQCDIGLVSLDSRHKSHNIPGKFISYMQSGIPVLASINPGNDLASLINQENIGRVSECNSVHHLELMALELISMLQTDKLIKNRCKEIYSRLFSPDIAVKKIIGELQS
ncbi:glycosyltransferase, partial [Chromobacterium vaccinii]|uniref:glycosyltransferase n=1 Tax=Chromobacterium vaccinii TaxID=1108595 RepID=UPI001E4B283E